MNKEETWQDNQNNVEYEIGTLILSCGNVFNEQGTEISKEVGEHTASRVSKECTLLIEELTRTIESEYHFFLNVLNGIDFADEEMGVKGGTLAIRHALKARYAGFGFSLNPEINNDNE